MAVSRPLLIVLIGAVLAATAWFATSGSRTPNKDAASIPAPKHVKPKGKTEAVAVKPRPTPRQDAAAKRAAAKVAGVPAVVTRTIRSGRTAVLFFFQRGAADDTATAAAVRGVRGQRGVKVFVIPIARVADYRAIVSGAGVSQAPSVVIATKRGAQLVEGYIDGQSLAQQVADAR
jgi:hypothetical protein